MRLRSLLATVSLLVAGGAACSTGTAPSETSARAQSEIINGIADTTHPAVVALALGNKDSFEGSCSGTTPLTA